MDPVDVRSLRFECTRCGDCCRRSGWIFLQEGEPERLASYLGVTLDAFRRERLAEVEPGVFAIKVPDGEGCPFLRDNLCTIHEVKPDQCRSYPFWLELLSDKKLWAKEATRCEGIGRGEKVPLATVQRLALLDPGVPDGGR